MAEKTWIRMRKDGDWTVLEECSHAPEPPREVLRVILPPKVTMAEIQTFITHLLREAEAAEATHPKGGKIKAKDLLLADILILRDRDYPHIARYVQITNIAKRTLPKCYRCAGSNCVSDGGAPWAYEPGPCDACHGEEPRCRGGDTIEVKIMGEEKGLQFPADRDVEISNRGKPRPN